MTRKYHGTPGHFTCADRCRFRLHTSVPGYRISTVGEYYCKPRDRKPTAVGSGRLYETYVFRLGPDGEPSSWTEVEGFGCNSEEGAEAAHEAMVRKYESADG